MAVELLRNVYYIYYIFPQKETVIQHKCQCRWGLAKARKWPVI